MNETIERDARTTHVTRTFGLWFVVLSRSPESAQLFGEYLTQDLTDAIRCTSAHRAHGTLIRDYVKAHRHAGGA